MELLSVLMILLAIALFIIVIWREASWMARQKQWKQELERRGKEAIKQSRAVLGGKFTEQLAPYLPEFQYDPTEARFIGTPVDLIVFPGLANKLPERVVFIEVKTGESQLTPAQRRIRDLIKDGMVTWEEMRLAGAEK
ncbi:Holliday junction resolvase-like protein [Chloroflexota bacterium]